MVQHKPLIELKAHTVTPPCLCGRGCTSLKMRMLEYFGIVLYVLWVVYIILTVKKVINIDLIDWLFR